MKHTFGNSPQCINCYYYRERTDDEKCRHDGFCNRRKTEIAKQWNSSCKQWEDAESRLNSYEVLTLCADPNRREAEQEYINEFIKRTVAEQKAERDAENKRRRVEWEGKKKG